MRMSVSLCVAVAVFAIHVVSCADVAVRAAPALRPLTAVAAIETARVIKNAESVSEINPDGAVSISPDGRRYVARIVRGDASRNGVWIDVVSGSLESLAAAASPVTVSRLFTTGRGSGGNDIGANLDTFADASSVRWLDDRYIAFQFSDPGGIRQVVGIDLQIGETKFLTQHSSHVAAFDAKRGGPIFYTAQAPLKLEPSEEMFRNGYAVSATTDVYSLLQGDMSGVTLIDRMFSSEWYIQGSGPGSPRKLLAADRRFSDDYRRQVVISPDSRYALVNASITTVPRHWKAYKDRFLQASMAALETGTQPGLGRSVHQLHVVDLEHGTARPLWDAPVLASLFQANWSNDGRYLLVAPVFLPMSDADPAGRAGKAAAVVDVTNGAYELVPLEVDLYGVGAVRWLNDREIEIVEHERKPPAVTVFRKGRKGWTRTAARLPPAAVRLELRQNLTTPPMLVAIDRRTSAEQEVIDPNRGLTATYSLGAVERISGKLPSGPAWDGLLFHPVGYIKGKRYPLVIQMVYGSSMEVSNAFTVYGEQMQGLGPTFIAPYAAQVLANRGIAVVHVNVKAPMQVVEEATWRAEGFEQVARQFAEAGLVDLNKVGVVGFSRNGYYVEHTLSHSSFPYAAAIAADNFDPSYVPSTFIEFGKAAEEVNGGPAFGDGLNAWLKNAPGFKADKIRTPLLKIAQTGGRYSVLAGWEMFSRLRSLGRPVEFYVMPDAERFGSHNTQNPKQLLAVQERSVDWFDFWLNGREDPDTRKSQQFQRWRHLRELQQTGRDDAVSRLESNGD